MLYYTIGDIMELCVQNLSFGYLKKPLCLTNINMNLSGGDVAVVLGGEGMGKTSLLRVICNLESQYLGFVKIDGGDIKEINPKDRKISYLPSEPVLLENKTVKDNLKFLFEVENIEPYSDEKLQEIFDKFSFKKSLYEKVKKLNLSEKRLLAIIRSYIKNSNILLIDEQAEGLSEENIKLIKNAISMLVDCKNNAKIAVLACNSANNINFGSAYYYLSYGKIKKYDSLKDVEKECLDLNILNYFDFKHKNYLLSKEDGNYYLNDYKIEYKNPKKQKGEIVKYLDKIKIDNSFTASLDKVGLEFDEELKVVLVSRCEGEILKQDDKLNKKLLSSEYSLFEEGTGVKIL